MKAGVLPSGECHMGLARPAAVSKILLTYLLSLDLTDVNIGEGNGWVHLGNKSLQEPMFTQQLASLGYNELIQILEIRQLIVMCT